MDIKQKYYIVIALLAPLASWGLGNFLFPILYKALAVESVILTGIISSLLALTAVGLLVVGLEGNVKDFLQLRFNRQTFRAMMFAMCVGLVIYVGVQLFALVLAGSDGGGLSSGTSTAIHNVQSFQWLTKGVLVPFVVPAIEELLYRGVVLSSAIRGFGVRAGVIWSGVVFGLAHYEGLSSLANTSTLLWTTVIGLSCASITVASRSIIPAIGLHSAYNLVTMLA